MINSYVEDQLRIGIVHERINLPFALSLGAYNFYLRAVLQRVVEEYKNTPEQVTATFTSLLKLVFLDMSLAIETYLSQRERGIHDPWQRRHIGHLFVHFLIHVLH